MPHQRADFGLSQLCNEICLNGMMPRIKSKTQSKDTQEKQRQEQQQVNDARI